MPKALAYLISSIFLNLSVITSVLARDDLAGSADHTKLPRIAGSAIIAHFSSEYAEHDFITGYNKENRKDANKGLQLVNKEGKLTRLVYALKKDQTSPKKKYMCLTACMQSGHTKLAQFIGLQK